VQYQLETVLQSECLAQRHQGDAGGVLPRVGGQLADAAADRRDAHHRFVDAAYFGAVAGTADAVAEQVKADADVADTGR
jgi:hypothetical protein